jgi:hypothetical protein
VATFVPEPSGFAVIMIGLFAVGGLAKRSRR